MKNKKEIVESLPAKSKQPAGKKAFLFKALTILLPLIFLIFLEFILRLFDYGDNTDLFVKYPPDTRYMVMNYHASEKFFPDTANSPIGNQEPFAINKSVNTIRIFVLGESTTIGYPFNPNGSFHRWLQYRLTHMYPDKNFEIINLALTAVNSYTVLDFGKQLAQYNPDAVLIYTGHNEYYGALGIGSTTYVGSNRTLVQALIKLRQFKTVQLLNYCVRKITGLFAGKAPGDRKSLMEVLAAQQHIAYQSADYKAGINQFDKNMTELCRTLNSEKIPVFLSTVVSNEKDLPPFISKGSAPGSAAWYYNAGQLALKKLRYDSAKVDFYKAKELDELRFRAPEEINVLIKRLAAKFPGVHLVDTKKLFEQYSPHGIIGSETILEHVHPNLFGYAIMSEAFYQAIKKQQLIVEKPEQEMSLDQLQKEMPITRMDSLKGLYEIMMLKTGWPFNQPIAAKFKVEKSIDASLAVKVALGHLGWTNAMGQLFRYAKKEGNNQTASKVAEAMVLQFPQNEEFYGFAGNLNAVLKNYSAAAFYYRKLFMLNKDMQLPLAVFHLYLKADDPASALNVLQYITAPGREKMGAILKQIITDESLLTKQLNNTQIKQRIVANYKQLGLNDTEINIK